MGPGLVYREKLKKRLTNTSSDYKISYPIPKIQSNPNTPCGQGAGQVLAAVVGFHVQLYDLPTDNLIPSVTAIFPLPLAEKAYEVPSCWTVKPKPRTTNPSL